MSFAYFLIVLASFELFIWRGNRSTLHLVLLLLMLCVKLVGGKLCVVDSRHRGAARFDELLVLRKEVSPRHFVIGGHVQCLNIELEGGLGKDLPVNGHGLVVSVNHVLENIAKRDCNHHQRHPSG